MIRLLLSAAVASLIFLHGPAVADEVKGAAAVKVQDPKRGSIPDLVYAYGTATPTSSATVTASFQRDGNDLRDLRRRLAISSRWETSSWISALRPPLSSPTTKQLP